MNNRKMRLPNGFGQITKIKNKRLRNPYRAMVTVGKTDEGKPICKMLKPQAYFRTYNDAYAALIEYNRNPYDLDSTLTVAELYEKWSAVYFESLKSEASARSIEACWSYCSAIKNMRARDVRARHIKGCMTDGIVVVRGVERNPTPGMQSRIKSMFNLMFDYALEYELVDKNYARTFIVSKDVMDASNKIRKGHIPFTDEEMEILWSNLGVVRYVDVILIQCYSGWRPQELGLLELENINLEEWTFTGGMKTEAGTNRVVPIHPRIRDIVLDKYKEAQSLNSKYLINATDATRSATGKLFTYDKYQKRFNKLRDFLKLDPNHRAHDGRVHFVTTAKKYNVDEYAIKYIVGHAVNDITEKVYTKREFEWLRTEIEKIK